MPKPEKVKVELKGRIRLLSPAAYEIAVRHFGATKKSVLAREVPEELLKIPAKTEIITKKSAPVLNVEQTPVAEQKAEDVKQAQAQKPLEKPLPANVTVVTPGAPAIKKAAKKPTKKTKK